MVFSDFPPSDTVKFEKVGPTFSNFRPFVFNLSEAKPVLNKAFVTSSVGFSKARQLLVDFQLIPSLQLDFQVALNLAETAPLKGVRLSVLKGVSIENR